MKKKSTLLIALAIACITSLSAQNLFWSGSSEDIYYASFETNAVLWYSGTHATSGLTVESSEEASLHGQRSAKFSVADGQSASAVNGSVTVILGGTNTYVDGNVGPIAAGEYVFKARIHIVDAAPSQLMVWFNESNVGISGAGSSNVNIPLDGVTVGGDPTTEGGWQVITGVVTLPAYAAMKTGLRTRPQDYGSVVGASTIYVDNMEIAPASPTDINGVKDVKVSLFPNPATTAVNIESEEGSSVEIISVAGVVVKSFVSTTEVEKVSVSDLTPGLYVVKLTKNGHTKTEKLIVK